MENVVFNSIARKNTLGHVALQTNRPIMQRPVMGKGLTCLRNKKETSLLDTKERDRDSYIVGGRRDTRTRTENALWTMVRNLDFT